MFLADKFLGEFPVPGYAPLEDVIRTAIPALLPPRRISVPEWAAANRRLRTPTYTGPWLNEFANYMVEPSRMTTSRKYGTVCFVGPARTVKTDALVLNTIGHRVDCMPRDILLVSMTKDAAKDLSEKKLGPLLRNHACLSEKQMTGRGSDNIHSKRFKGGMYLTIGWPVIGYFSQNEYPDVLITDYDRIPADIDGEGSAFDLARKRTQTFGSQGMVIVESSPGRSIIRDDWKPETPHEAPPTSGGIVPIYNRGTRGQFYWPCPHCNEPFRPLFETLKWDEKGSPGEMAKTVAMVCPNNGCIIGPDRKPDLIAEGFYLHESNSGELVEIDDPNIRETDIYSASIEGPAAAMQDWGEMVLRYIQAEEQFQQTGDETALRTTVNVDQGKPYLPRVLTVGEGLHEATLKALAIHYPMQVAPENTAFLTISVDVQATRFVVQVDAWRRGLERFLIDRFDLTTPPDTSPNVTQSRAIDPGRYREDWTVLFDLLEKVYPVQGGAYGLMARGLIVDLRGAAGVTQNAYRFLREANKRGLGGRVFLANNAAGLEGDRAFIAEPEKVLGNRKKRRTDLRLVRIRTDMLKDEIALALTRKDEGPGVYRLPEELPDNIFAEFCAEHRTEKGWERIKSGSRNEALDLAVYGKGLVIVLGGERINWEKPTNWAIAGEGNPYAILNHTKPPVEDEQDDFSPKVRRRSKRGQGFVSRGFQ